MLDNLVLQCRNPLWPLPPIGLRNKSSPGWLRTIRAAMDPTVQINKPIFQSGPVLFPCDPVHSRSSLTFQRVEPVSKQLDRQRRSSKSGTNAPG
jgi:hypothetical protein